MWHERVRMTEHVSAAELRQLRKKPPRVRGAQRTTVDGITFHSKREALRWQALKLLERGGVIRNLQRQVIFLLEVNGEFICRYIADFTYSERVLYADRYSEEVFIVEDVKGHVTDRYRIKRALMRACHGITIRET